ncbi:hypothetical protein Tco_1345698 [Tanacetum coccineum]
MNGDLTGRINDHGIRVGKIAAIKDMRNNAPNMFSIRIHDGGKYQRYPWRMYVSGHVDIFDMVDIDLFIVVALNMMVVHLGYTSESEPLFYNYLRPLISLDEGLYALACEEDVCCLATLVRSFKLIEAYIEHGVTTLDSYIRPPRFRKTIEKITTEPSSIAPVEHISEKMLLLTWHDSSESTNELVCEYVTPRSLLEHDSNTHCKDSVFESVTPRCIPHYMLTPPSNKYVITYTQLRCVQGVDTQDHVLLTIQSQFSNINLSFVSQQATASQVIDDLMRQLSFEETKLGGEAGFANVAGSGVESSGLSHDESFGVNDLDLNLNEPVNLNVSQIKTQYELSVSREPDIGRSEEQPIVEDVIVEDYSSEDASTDDDEDEDFYDLGNDDETSNYRRRRLAELSKEMEGVINASGQWKYSFYTGQKFTTAKKAKDILYVHSIKSKRNLKLYKNESVKIRARCDG